MNSLKILLVLSTVVTGSAFASSIESYSGIGKAEVSNEGYTTMRNRNCNIDIHKNDSGEVVKITGKVIGKAKFIEAGWSYYQVADQTEFDISIEKESFKNLKKSNFLLSDGYKLTDKHSAGSGVNKASFELNTEVRMENSTPDLLKFKVVTKSEGFEDIVDAACGNLKLKKIN